MPDSTSRHCRSPTCGFCRSPSPRRFQPSKPGKRRQPATRSRCSPRTSASLSPNWRNSRSRSANGRPRRRSTGILRTRPSPGPAGVASRAGLQPMSMQAKTRKSSSADLHFSRIAMPSKHRSPIAVSPADRPRHHLAANASFVSRGETGEKAHVKSRRDDRGKAVVRHRRIS